MTEEWHIIIDDPFFVEQKLNILYFDEFCISETEKPNSKS